MSFQQAVAWWCVADKGLTPAELLRACAEIGYTGVEMPPEEHFQLVHDHNLKIVTIGGHNSLTDGLNKRENHAGIEAEIREKLALAQQWNIPNLIVFSGNRDGQSNAKGLAITVEGLRKLAPLAAEAGVTLILELLNSKIDHPDYMCDHTAWGAEVIRQVEAPNVKLLYDIYHMQVMEGDIINTIRTNYQAIGHYHTAGVPGRNEFDNSQELNYAPIMQAIKATGYTGYIGQEFVPLREPVASLTAAYQLCAV